MCGYLCLNRIPTKLNLEEKLLETIFSSPNSDEIGDIAENLEYESDYDLNKDIGNLKGVWELRWSSSRVPFLKYSPLIDNLQILDPYSLNGMNLLKPKGINKIIGSAILAKLNKLNGNRIGVTFTHAGFLGPKLGSFKIKGLLNINREQKGWLDITYLSNNIRICRGDKGTLFVLLKKKNNSLYENFIEFNKCFNK